MSTNNLPTSARAAADITPQRERDYWTGYWDATRRLSTSPRFNRPQMEVIRDQAAMCQERLQGLGVEFSGPVREQDPS